MWPGTHVQQDNIKVLVHELRHALGDNPEAPRYVQSEAGRGYSFVAAVADAPCPMLEGSGHSHPPSIARDYVMTAIDGALDAALNRREAAHLYFEGIAGSGKTTVCQEIYRRASRWPSVRVAYGRAHRTSTEPFPAIVALLERLVARYPREAAPVVERRAPTWFAHLQNRSTIVDQHPNAENAAKLAFELVDAFVEIGQHEPFVLILEDLHWTQTPSLDILSMLAAEAIPSRIVVVATYAPFASLPAGSRRGTGVAGADSEKPSCAGPVASAVGSDGLGLSGTPVRGPVRRRVSRTDSWCVRRPRRIGDSGGGQPGRGWIPAAQHFRMESERAAEARARTDCGPRDRRHPHGPGRIRPGRAPAASRPPPAWAGNSTRTRWRNCSALSHPAALRHGFDVLATHLPIFERTAPAPGRRPDRWPPVSASSTVSGSTSFGPNRRSTTV